MTEPLSGKDQASVASLQQALLDQIAQMMVELHPHAQQVPAVRLGSRLDRDLGLDSLSRIELLARLERHFRVVLPDTDALTATTPGELLHALELAAPREAIVVTATVEAARAETARFELPETARTLPEVLDWHCERHADRNYVRFEGGAAHGTLLSYGELRERATRIAAGLQQLELRPLDPVALMLPTHPDFLVAFFGVLLAGGVPVPLYPPMRPGELADYWHRQAGILRNCGARILLVDASIQSHQHLVRSVTGPVEHIVTVTELSDSPPLQSVALSPDDLAMLQYTSGSTADPKGVMLTHRNMLANLRTMGSAIRVSADDVFVSWLPLYHDMGLIGACLGTLYYGIPLVLMPPQTFLLRPERWLWAIHRYRATLSAAPNFALELCVYRVPDSAIQGLDLSRWRLAFCGAEPVFEETLARFSQRFASFGFRREALFPVYGLAENTLGLTFPPIGRVPKMLRVARDPFLQRGVAQPAQGTDTLAFVSCGQPLPGHEIRIVDEGDRELPDGTQGSVQFRGPSATSGYFHATEITRHLFHGSWLDSGDLGFIFEGELYLTGRVKDLIIRAGRHIHPQAIEQMIGSVAGVRRGRVAVFGSYAGNEGTERLVVVAETRVTDVAALAALRAQVNTVAEDFTGGPADEVVLTPPGSVLKTSSGKLRRSACRAAYEAGTLGKAHNRALIAVLLRGLIANVRGRLRRVGAIAFAVYAWTILALLVIPAFFALAVLPQLTQRWQAMRTVIGILRTALCLPLTLHVEQTLPEQPCIFVANHSSYIDALILLWTLPRPVAFAAKTELSRQPLLRWLLARLGAVFVERSDQQRSTEVVGQAQEGQRDFLFFPEGTFYRMPGLLPFHLGAFLAAARANLPVVPIALRGTRAVLRDVEWFPRRAPVEVTIGAPLTPQSATDHWHEALRLSQASRRFLLDHCGEPDAGDRTLPVSPSP